MAWRSASLLGSPGRSTIVHSCPLGPLRPLVYSTTLAFSQERRNAMFCPSRLFRAAATTAPRTATPRDVRGSRPAYQPIELPGYKAAPSRHPVRSTRSVFPAPIKNKSFRFIYCARSSFYATISRTFCPRPQNHRMPLLLKKAAHSLFVTLIAS
jgi:hypothetical protein